MHEDEETMCPCCLSDEIDMLRKEVSELDKLVSVIGYMLVMFGIAVLYLLLK